MSIKLLYAIQGTGNGHVARAREIVPLLSEMAEVDVLLSGVQANLDLPFPVKYRMTGLSFIFGKKGGVAIGQTLWRMRPFRLLIDILRLPVSSYDLVINDFEPVSAWACLIRRQKCIALSHQYAVLHPDAPRPEHKDRLGSFILRNYAPVSRGHGFHFRSLGKHCYSPVIRNEIRVAKKSNLGHYTVYLPAYSDDAIIRELSVFKQINWHVFSKHGSEAYTIGNISVFPVGNESFIESFISCEGILCNAGFETPAEALYMGKKLCVIPMTNQYEQQCNAAFLASMGVPVSSNLNAEDETLQHWVADSKITTVNYPDQTRELLQQILDLEINCTPVEK